jgi:hypothetical protein
MSICFNDFRGAGGLGGSTYIDEISRVKGGGRLVGKENAMVEERAY